MGVYIIFSDGRGRGGGQFHLKILVIYDLYFFSSNYLIAYNVYMYIRFTDGQLLSRESKCPSLSLSQKLPMIYIIQNIHFQNKKDVILFFKSYRQRGFSRMSSHLRSS